MGAAALSSLWDPGLIGSAQAAEGLPGFPNFAPKAKRAIYLFFPGGPSHIDTFDYKPALEKQHGQKADYIPKVTFEGPPGNVAKAFWDFKPRGQTGKMVSDLLPNLAALTDDFCFFHALHTETAAHPQGENFFNTGSVAEAATTVISGDLYCGVAPFKRLANIRPIATGKKNDFII